MQQAMSCSQKLKTSFGNMSDLSGHQAENNDIMSEIFLRLPPETVYKLILVSKRWLQIISDPLFRRTYLTKWKPKSNLIGFFICKTKKSGSFKYELRRPPFEFYHPLRTILGDEIKSLKQLGHYIDSSNGFILCINQHPNPNDYYLWNPSTGRRHRIPHHEVHLEYPCTSLVIEEDGPFSYKVIRVECVNKPSAKLKVDTFSSKTNTWTYSEMTCPEPMILILGGGGTVIGGFVYWYATGGRVAFYDTNSNEKRIGLVKLPKIHDNEERVLTHSPDGCLQYGRSSKSVMEIWKLGKVNGLFQWKLQNKVNFKVVWRWYDVKAERLSSTHNEVKKLFAFPIRNESQTCSSRPGTITEEEEEQGVLYGTSAMSCHSFDDNGFPFFVSFIKGADVSKIIGKKLMRHYMSS
ncbi:F-box protein At5g03970 isoform X1 [Brassica rapa]|uniref:F-box protein At5g03970 isoform X1 n=1 Tax=Brassica campestris TaxID=3711 RepID=UPI00142DFCF6|nr:F-box protein At5g03970 isoform X1 [Brassica rapa]XP_033136088.1 F-box protein At5g03970 isoform X1 [Brassica rapa]